MTTAMKWTGLAATLVVMLVLPLVAWLEPVQQAARLEDFHTDAVISAVDRYAQNCAVCHGSAGEGIGDVPPLDSEALRSMSAEDLGRVISRGSEGTMMAGWAIAEGGIFSNAQIDEFVTLIQEANWEYVRLRVEEMGLTPPELVRMDVSEEMLASISSLQDGDVLAAGLAVYAGNCAACHGGNGAGTVIAPALDSADLRSAPEADLLETIKYGVPGTLMAGWADVLSPVEIDAVLSLIYRWPELAAAGLEFPEVEVVRIPATPEMIAAGQNLFNVACKACHGVDGYGSPMAPALNNQVFLSQTPDAAIYQIIAGGVPGTLMPAWGSRLDDVELQSLVAFLRSLEETAPVIVPPVLSP